MSLTGHKNVASIESYAQGPTTDEKVRMLVFWLSTQKLAMHQTKLWLPNKDLVRQLLLQWN